MSSSPPNLLTLPREIRDNIYTHLHHSIDIDWFYTPNTTEESSTSDYIISIPRSQVVQHTSRTPQSQALDVAHISEPVPGDILNARVHAAFAHTTHATILIKARCFLLQLYPDPSDSLHISTLLHSFTSATPNLRALRIALIATHPSPLLDRNLPTAMHVACTACPGPLPRLPESLENGRMQCVQRATCSLKGFSRDFRAAASRVNPDYILLMVLLHEVKRVDVYTYVRQGGKKDGREEVELWREAEVKEFCGMKAYPEGCSRDERTNGMAGWVEERRGWMGIWFEV
ncbi:hypothetical protein EK21DRAFT_110560 [Setomelanomma holmii]|uniref:Uncharacterized protein n=1 Tax=Setomelanomma holmii TaxID=210430 RepID=A0A9P4LNB8_9PLEO|nr:hypothetical protein EK21DRAFT_110560 [Setomelanomma holmii]